MTERFGAIRHHYKKSIVADLDVFYSPYVPENERWWIESSSSMNDTTDNTECLISIERAGSLFPVVEHINLTVDLWGSKDLRLWLFPGERLAFTWINVIAADLVEFSCVGHRRID